ncbi:MAG: NUDIX hydrolase [Nitrososphaerales archaeon]
MSTVKGRFAIFGTGQDNRSHTPEKGVCLSSFLIIRKGEDVLLGKVGDAELWKEKWCLPWIEERWRDKWVLPASHLLMGEHPNDAANRILREMLGQESLTPTYHSTQSFVGETGHWDVCFIYTAQVDREVPKPAWFSELGFLNVKELEKSSFGRGHDEVLKEVDGA